MSESLTGAMRVATAEDPGDSGPFMETFAGVVPCAHVNRLSS